MSTDLIEILLNNNHDYTGREGRKSQDDILCAMLRNGDTKRYITKITEPIDINSYELVIVNVLWLIEQDLKYVSPMYKKHLANEIIKDLRIYNYRGDSHMPAINNIYKISAKKRMLKPLEYLYKTDDRCCECVIL